MNWKQIAERRLTQAKDEVREAKDGINARNINSHRRYENAIRELAAAERFLVRTSRTDEVSISEGQGLFG